LRRSLSKGRQSLAARNAGIRSGDVTGAGNKASPIYARDAVSGGPETMGNVALILRVMPESPDVDLEDLKTRLRAEIKGLQDIREEPIGFGLKALKIAVVVSDAGGESDAIEAEIMALDGVERAEVIELTLT
jgi:elongation factor 1-beta